MAAAKQEVQKQQTTAVATPAEFNTQLSYYTNRYVDLMEKDLSERGMNFDSYSKECVVSAMGAIFQLVHESGLEFSAINGSNLKFIMQKVASLKLNANAHPRECYFQIRNVNVTPKGSKTQKWEKKIEFNIEGDGNDSLVQRYGTNVKKVHPYWKVRECDVYIPPKHKGIEVTPPEWEESGSGKVVRIVYPIEYNDGHIEYHSCERSEVARNIAAQIKQTLQNETFGIAKDSYSATEAQKKQISGKKKELLAKVSELKDIDAIIDCEELRPYISPSYLEFQSRESMIIRKMRNNVMKSIPKRWENELQAYEYNMLDSTYREHREEIETSANKEEFMEDVPDAVEAETIEPEVINAESIPEEVPEFMKD